MNRAFWFVAGAGASVYAMVRARRAAEAFTPEGLRDRGSALGLGARMFRDEVAQGRADAEIDLRQRLLPTYESTPELAPPTSASTQQQTTQQQQEEGSN